MNLDPSIILQGQPVNMLGALSTSNQMAAQQKDALHTQGYRNMLATNGADIMAGGQEGMNALAGYDPAAAMGIMGQRQGMDMDRQRMSILTAQEKRQAEQYAAGLTAEQRAQEAAQIEGLVKMGMGFYQSGNEAGYQAWAGSMGIDPSMMPAFADLPNVARQYMAWGDLLKADYPEPLSKEGKLAADIASGIVPEGTTSTPETVIQMGGDKFAEELGKLDAQALTEVATAGMAAKRNINRIGKLEAVLQQSPTGLGAALSQMAGEIGINTHGLDSIQTAQAIINSLVPEQRQPGSGPMSDADLALFKESLPRIINQPGGNQAIIEIMKGIAVYDAEGAEIVQKLRSGEIDRAKAFELLNSRANPLEAFSAGGSAAPAAAPGAAPVVIDGYSIEAID
jgi:hypothetical protein